MSLIGPEQPRPLGKNINGYYGERIADRPGKRWRIAVALAQAQGWKVENIPVSTNLTLSALKRPGPVAAPGQPARHTPRVYISAGIHGDEPAGPLAVRQLLQENRWPAGHGLLDLSLP